MKRKQKYLVAIALALVLFGRNGQTAEAATLRVSGSNGAAIQSALDSASSGDTVIIPAGNYQITQQIYQKGKNLTIEGEGEANLNILTPAGRRNGLFFSGSAIGPLSLSANAFQGSSQIVVANASQVHVGDMIEIWKNVLWCPNDYPDQKTGEIYLITAISGSTITLNQPILRDYRLVDSVNIELLRPIEMHIKNLRIKGAGAAEDRSGLVIAVCKNSSVTDSWFSDNGMTGVSFYASFNVSIKNNEIYNSAMPGSGYGVGIWSGTAFVDIQNNYIENCRHDITGNTDERVTLIRDVYIANNVLVGGTVVGANVIDAHAIVINYTVTKNKIYPQPGFYAFIDGSQQSIFSDNEVYGGSGAVVRRGSVVNGYHIIKNNITKSPAGYTYRAYGPGLEGDTLIISNNVQEGGVYGVSFATAQPESFKNIIISGNKFSGIQNQALYMVFSIDNVNVSAFNNTFEDISSGGVYIDGNDHPNGKIKITNNILKNVNTSGGNNSGIAIDRIDNSSICSNIISDSSGRAKYGIYEGIGSNGNSIFGNTITGMASGEIHWNGIVGSSSGVCPIPEEVSTPDILWSYGFPEGYEDSSPNISYSLVIDGGTGSGSYPCDSTVTITADPAVAGKVFDKWTGDTGTISSTYTPSDISATVNVSQDTTLVATYKDAPNVSYLLTITNGTGDGSYLAGTKVTITADPAPVGKVFDKWTGIISAVASTTSATTTVTMPASATTITATYKDIITTYYLTINSGSGDGNYTSGTKVTVTASPAVTGMVFDKWTGDTDYLSSLNSSTAIVTMPSKAVNLTAHYIPITTPEITYSLLVNFGSGDGKYVQGTKVTITADAPVTGKVFDKWTGDITYISSATSATTTVTMPSRSTTLTATYKLETVTKYALTVNQGSGDGSYISGTQIAIKADVPLADQAFDKWTGDTEYVSSATSSSATVTIPAKAITLTATYKSQDASLPDGTLIKTPDSNKVYVVIGGEKKWLSTPEVFEQMGYTWSNIKVIATMDMDNYIDFEDNLIRAIGEIQVYLVVSGTKRHIPNPHVFLSYGFSWKDVKEVTKETKARYKDAYLVRESGRQEVYYLNPAGVRKHIPSQTVFDSYQDNWSDVQIISSEEMQAHPASNLIQLEGTGDVYLLENNVKKHISSPQVFSKYQFDWNHIISVNQVEFDWYNTGSEVR